MPLLLVWLWRLPLSLQTLMREGGGVRSRRRRRFESACRGGRRPLGGAMVDLEMRFNQGESEGFGLETRSFLTRSLHHDCFCSLVSFECE